MQLKDKIIIWVFWFCLMIMLTAILIKIEPKIITKEIKQDCPIQINHSETVYLINEKEIKQLPFCALISDDSWDYCYDWAYWAGYRGVSIINLKTP